MRHGLNGRLMVAAALALAATTLSGCDDTDEPAGAPSASPAQTLATRHPQKGKPDHGSGKKPQKMVHSVVKGGGKASGESRAALDAVVAQGQQALDGMMTDAMKKVYSDIRIEPDYPSGVTYIYVFRNAVPPNAAAGIATQSDSFQNIFDTTLAPALEMQGLENPTATFTFRRPDGSLIWSHTYHG